MLPAILLGFWLIGVFATVMLLGTLGAEHGQQVCSEKSGVYDERRGR